MMHSTRLASLFLLLALLSLGLARPPQGGSGLGASDVQVLYNFGEQITFQARLSAPAAIQQASILFHDLNESITRLEAIQTAADGTAVFRYDASQKALHPFATIAFWYRAILQDGRTVESPFFYFRYDDNRFPWRTVSDGPLNVHWYAGDDAFGQAALDAAKKGLAGTGPVVAAAPDIPFDIYVYAASEDLRGALTLGGQEWTAGHADPALGVVMVSVAPGEAQSLELERQIPHELAHVMLYRGLGAAGYERLPAWLNEGIATMAELSPNPDYAGALRAASQNNSLIPFADLCTAFPPDSGRAFLAYAQSESFVRYLRETSGDTGLVALAKAYADGLDCDLGATRALGAPLSRLEARWRESALGQNVAGVATRNLLPYVILLGAGRADLGSRGYLACGEAQCRPVRSSGCTCG
jgi:hypothetical protein